MRHLKNNCYHTHSARSSHSANDLQHVNTSNDGAKRRGSIAIFISKLAKLRLAKRRNSKSNEPETPETVDPVYLAIKQATALYPKHDLSPNTSTASLANNKRRSSQDMRTDSPLVKDEKKSSNEAIRRRAPKLNDSMKAMSLDCQDGLSVPSPRPLCGTARKPCDSTQEKAHNLLKPYASRRVLKAQHASVSLDDAASSSESPCPSSQGASTSSINNNVRKYVCIRDVIENRVILAKNGDQIFVDDFLDVNLVRGCVVAKNELPTASSARVTMPLSSLTPLDKDERVMRVTQHLNLATDTASLRLSKNELVFAGHQSPQVDAQFLVVRTINNVQCACPKIYLQEY